MTSAAERLQGVFSASLCCSGAWLRLSGMAISFGSRPSIQPRAPEADSLRALRHRAERSEVCSGEQPDLATDARRGGLEDRDCAEAGGQQDQADHAQKTGRHAVDQASGDQGGGHGDRDRPGLTMRPIPAAE
jgi:hypothetical protein